MLLRYEIYKLIEIVKIWEIMMVNQEVTWYQCSELIDKDDLNKIIKFLLIIIFYISTWILFNKIVWLDIECMKYYQ